MGETDNESAHRRRDTRQYVAASSGTGKTHIGLGLGLAACQKGFSVGFTIAAALVHELIEARDEKRLLHLQTIAVRDAIARGAIGFDAVKHLVLCRIERRPPRLDMTIYPYLPKAVVATTSAKAYLGLLTGAAS